MQAIRARRLPTARVPRMRDGAICGRGAARAGRESSDETDDASGPLDIEREHKGQAEPGLKHSKVSEDKESALLLCRDPQVRHLCAARGESEAALPAEGGDHEEGA